MRVSTNQYDSEERLSSGFDYEHQAWVWNGVYVRCGHPESMACGCYGRAHEGEKPGAQSALDKDRVTANWAALGIQNR